MMLNRVFFYLCFLSSVFGGRNLFGNNGLVYALPSVTGIQPGTTFPPPSTYGGYYQPVSYGTYQYQPYGGYATPN